MLSTKKALQSTIFWTFKYFNENSPSSSWHFWKHKVKSYSSFTSLFSVMKDNCCVFFSSSLHTLGKKSLSKCSFQTFWVVGWKLTKFLMSCLKLQVSFFLSWFVVSKRIKNLVSFDPSAQKPQNLALWLVPFVKSI